MKKILSTRPLQARRAPPERQGGAFPCTVAPPDGDLVASLPNAVIVVSEDGLLETANAAACRLLALEADHAWGQPAGRFLPETVIEALGHGLPVPGLEAEFVDARGRTTPVLVAVTPRYGESGGFIVTATDISACKAEEARLLQSEKRFRVFSSIASDWFWEMDAQFRFVWFSPNASDPLGVDASRLIGRSRHEIAVSDELNDPGKWQRHLADLQQQRPFRNFEYRLASGDMLGFRWISISGAPIHDADGTFLGYRGVGRNISARKEAEQRLLDAKQQAEAAEERLRRLSAEQQLILDHSVVGICFLRDRTIQRCNRRFEEMLGFDPGELDGQSVRVNYFSDEAYRRVGHLAYPILDRGETFADEVLLRRKDNEPIWARITGKAIDPHRRDLGSIWNFEDITARRQAEEAARQSQILQRAILESASLAIVSTDVAGHVISVNPAAEALLATSAAELTGHLASDTFVVAESLPAPDLDLLGYDYDPVLSHARHGDLEEFECRFRRRDGTTLPVQLAVTPLRHRGEESIQGFLLVASDISDRKRAEAALRQSRDALEERVRERTAALEVEIGERRNAEHRLRHLAQHDPLTDLPNRSLLRQRIDEACQRASAEGNHAGLFFIDLDRFKTINDSLGHHCGDILLKEVARRLGATLRAGDTIARLGGDEFVVVAPGLEAPAQVETIAAKLHAALAPATLVEGHELVVTPSIGVCLYPDDGDNADSLLRNADTAMYAAKDGGRNTWRRFDPRMTAAAEQYFQIENALRRAVERREFEVFYQPIMDLASGRPAALEALVRWHHPQLGLIGPDRFIPVAEDTGLIVAIGEQVLAMACAQWRTWRKSGHQPPPICINVSPVQFKAAGIADALSRVVAEAGIPNAAIELEITESTLMQDGEGTIATLDTLAQRGFRLSIDDFGTGYSSLAYLKRFPIDKLKIDRSFIRDMTADENDEAIVATVLALSRTLKLAVVAEGAETRAQITRLRDMGCDCAQGFFYARPLPAGEVAACYLDAAGST